MKYLKWYFNHVISMPWFIGVAEAIIIGIVIGQVIYYVGRIYNATTV